MSEPTLESRVSALEAREAKKTVPMAMLEELVEYGLNSSEISETARIIKKHEIAARFGYEVTE